jgi:hypothetical protein
MLFRIFQAGRSVRRINKITMPGLGGTRTTDIPPPPGQRSPLGHATSNKRRHNPPQLPCCFHGQRQAKIGIRYSNRIADLDGVGRGRAGHLRSSMRGCKQHCDSTGMEAQGGGAQQYGRRTHYERLRHPFPSCCWSASWILSCSLPDSAQCPQLTRRPGRREARGPMEMVAI